MTRYVALLRAVNVGKRQLPMQRLRDVAGELGYADLATYVQSGNLTLTTPDSAHAVERALSAALTADRGFDVDVTVRSRAQLAALLKADALGDAADDDAKRAVTFLAAKPGAAVVRGLDPDEFLPERFVVTGRELVMWCPHGLGRSKLATARWSSRLGGIAGTTRNWRTVGKLVELLDGA
jgi:uncharacterized protein (DUF1697 family)